MGYSRRIYRPSLWQLNPFINIRNNFNISAGNPDLRPEYSDSYELAAIYNTSVLSINCGIYQLNTTEKITYVTSLENNISKRSPENLGTSNTNGIEINGKLEFHGSEKNITVSSILDEDDSYLNLKGTFQVKPTEFLIKLPSFMLAEINDLLTINFELFFKK